MALTDKLTAIANAIRAKTGKTTNMTLAEMPSEIASIQTGITPSGSITLTEEKSYDVTEKATAVVDFSATRAALAEAVTAKGVDTLPDSSFDTIANHIGLIEGGGGSLPPGITKQASGSFTLDVDTNTPNHPITHNLGEIPKMFYIWTDDETSASAVDIYALINSCFQLLTHDAQAGASVAGIISTYYRVTTGKTNMTNRQPTSAQLSSYATETTFNVNNNSVKYRTGNTYKWIAIA